jgi:hypothetical protein
MIFIYILCSSLLLLLLSTAAVTTENIHKVMALGVATTNTTAIVSQSPIYSEVDKPTSQKAVMVNGTTHATEETFSGHGTAKGVNFTDSGKAMIIPKGNSGFINGKGHVVMMTSSGDKASATFEEIGHSDVNGMITASGAAFFDANATGKLAFLGNAVAVYKDIIFKDGTDKGIAWEWK